MYFLRNVAAFFQDVFLKVYCEKGSGRNGLRCWDISVEDGRGRERVF